MEKQLVELAQRIRAIAQNGLVYAPTEYDTERYTELLEISHRLNALLSGHTPADISACFTVEKDYVTPKVDVRAVVFNEHDEILLVQERADGCWAMPGGWADVGYSPGEVAVKEVKEETGLNVVPVKLLAVLDKRCHNHPPALHYAYKLFILCQITGGELSTTFDILDCRFFARHQLPPLSLERTVQSQIDMAFDYKNHPHKPAVVD